jgi:hypothetical protein
MAQSVAETVERDLPCLKCNYNLRGLAANGRCPECGDPVWKTRLTRPDHRAFQRFERLRVMYGLAAIGCFCLAWYANSEYPNGPNTADPRKAGLRVLFTISGTGSWILIASGICWLIASRYPRRSKFTWWMLALNGLTAIFSLPPMT